MKKIQTASLIALFISIMGSVFTISAQDQVTLNNNSGNEIGLLVDGDFNGFFVNDKTYLTNGSPVAIGSFNKAKGNKTNEVMAFTKDRPFEILTPPAWTSGSDNVTLTYANKILIPITMWIVYGNFDSVKAKVLNDLITVSSAFTNEFTGIDFSTVTFMDATANPLAPNYYYFNSNWTGLTTDIGHVSGQLNVYYMNYLNLSGTYYTNAGIYHSGTDQIAIGSTTKSSLLMHEIGHSFSLAHITGLVSFDSSNVMTQQNRLNSLYLTEGQNLRIHLSSYSVINSIYNARPGKLIRNCGSTATTATNTCPELQKRIWADGNAPPNVTENKIQNRSTNVKQLATNWLNLNCFDNEEGLNERTIILKHSELRPYFVDIIEKGLQSDILDEEKEMAGQLYDKNMKMLNEEKPIWVTKDYKDIFNSVSREQFIAKEIETLKANYASQAIKGLAILSQVNPSIEILKGMKTTSYPNPVVDDKITIEYTLNEFTKDVSIFIFNQTGKRLVAKNYYDQSAGSYKVDIDIKDLTPGNYFYQLNGNKYGFTKKFAVIK